MTVAELINYLQAFPPDALVVTEGYEDGFDTIKTVSLIKVEENSAKDWWVGQYVDSEKADAIKAVFLDAETKADTV